MSRTRTMAAPEAYHLAGSVGRIGMGRHDPCARFEGGAFWWGTRTPDGPGTLRVWRDGAHVVAEAYGPGAGWLLDRADAVAGLRDDLTGFAEVAAAHPLVARLARERRGVRLPATGCLFPRLFRAILEQKVTGKEAYRAYAAAMRHFGEPAPGPLPRLLVPAEPEAVAATPYWVFHPFGVEQRRTQAILRAALVAHRLQECADSAGATRRMLALPGIGPWTAAEVVRDVYGDADAVSVGDYHIPNTVAWALAGEIRGDDARMLELLAPFTGHRGRVCVLLESAGIGAPRFGPRMPVRSFAAY